LLGLLVLAWIHADRLPAPLYDTQYTHEKAPAVFVTTLYPMELAFTLPRAAKRLRVPVWTEPSRDPIELVLRDGQANELDRATATHSEQVVLSLGPDAARVRDIVLSISSPANERDRAPRVLWADGPPRFDAEVRYGGRDLGSFGAVPHTGPLLWVEYPWPTRWLLLVWILPVLLAIGTWRDTRRLPWLWAALALAACVTSALLWQQDYTRQIEYLDADRYAESARQIARYASEPESREVVRAWYQRYPHASTPLVQALVAVPVLLGVPAALAYLAVSALAGFAALLVFTRMLAVELACRPRVVLLTGIAFTCHVAMLRAFARPVSDGVGLLLVVLTLWLLVRRFGAVGPRDGPWLSLVLLMQALARPQGLAYWFFVAVVVLLADSRRGDGPVGWGRAIGSAFKLFAPPLALLAALYVSFGWLHNVELMFEKAARFRINAVLPIYLHSLTGLLQIQPLLWIRAGLRLREPTVALSLAWIGFCLLLLIVVQAPFWLRHFLPILPAAFILSGLALDRAHGRRRSILACLLAGMSLLNVAATVHLISTTGPIHVVLAGFISDP